MSDLIPAAIKTRAGAASCEFFARVAAGEGEADVIIAIVSDLLLAERETAKETLEQIHAVHKAFGAPGDYGYETRQGKALYGLYRAGNALQARLNGDGT